MKETRIDDATDFTCVLIDELIGNSFIGVEVHNGYSEREESYLFTITTNKKGKEYTHWFYVKEKSLNYKTIKRIVNWFSK